MLALVTSQLAGAVAGAFLLRIVSQGTTTDLGATLPSVGAGSALVYEAMMTAFLMFVIMAVATDMRAVGAAAIAIGGTVALDSLFCGGVTGASIEPGSLVGHALVAGESTESGSTSLALSWEHSRARSPMNVREAEGLCPERFGAYSPGGHYRFSERWPPRPEPASRSSIRR